MNAVFPLIRWFGQRPPAVVDAPAAPLEALPPLGDVAKLYDFTADVADLVHIDNTTWSDMLLDAHLARVSDKVSMLGRQWLYRQLRGGAVVRKARRVAAWLDRQSTQSQPAGAGAVLRRENGEAA